MDCKNIGKNAPVSDTGDRRIEGIVPASRASLTGEGLSTVSMVSTVEERVITMEPVCFGEGQESKNKSENKNVNPTLLPAITSNEQVMVKLERIDNIVDKIGTRLSRERRCKKTKQDGSMKGVDTGSSCSERAMEVSSAMDTPSSYRRGEGISGISPRKGKRKKVNYPLDSSDEELELTKGKRKIRFS